jgi:hypothetical protein
VDIGRTGCCSPTHGVLGAAFLCAFGLEDLGGGAAGDDAPDLLLDDIRRFFRALR